MLVTDSRVAPLENCWFGDRYVSVIDAYTQQYTNGTHTSNALSRALLAVLHDEGGIELAVSN